MTPTLLTLALLITVAVGMLAFFQAGLAIQHDRVVDAAPFLGTKEELERQIEDARQVLTDINAQIDERREAMEHIARDEAEVDALNRMRQEILDEINRLEDRREEIRQMDRETEEALARLSIAQHDLDEANEKLQSMQARLERAATLTAQIADLEEQETRLTVVTTRLREELSDLRQMQQDESHLRERLETLRREEAHLDGSTSAAQERLNALTANVAAAEERRAEFDQGMQELLSRTASATTEILRLEEARAALEARVAHLRAEKGELDGSGTQDVDPLRDLKIMPAVLRQLGRLGEHETTTEQEALHRVRQTMEANGLDYPDRTIRAFHTAMKVNDTTQMAVLAGISGTGKSQLPRRYAEGMGIGFLQVPVQPRWDSPQDLMGFYNYIENRFRPTEMARALFHLDQFSGQQSDADLQNRMMMILLDEMNLARVEYYFSDFLSRLESRPPRDKVDDETARKDASIELELRMLEGQSAPTIFPGYNLLFAGTMNEDESTQSLSDKVVDRANILRFAAPKTLKKQRSTGAAPVRKALTRVQWDNWLRTSNGQGRETGRVDEYIEKLAGLMRELHRPIGHRMGVAIGAYVANYPEREGRADITTPLADQVEMRLLPKLRGVEMEAASGPLEQMVALVDSDFNDHELSAAIRESAELSEETGQFSWRGVSRS